MIVLVCYQMWLQSVSSGQEEDHHLAQRCRQSDCSLSKKGRLTEDRDIGNRRPRHWTFTNRTKEQKRPSQRPSDKTGTWEAETATTGVHRLVRTLTQLETRRSNPLTLIVDRRRLPSLRTKTTRRRSWEGKKSFEKSYSTKKTSSTSPEDKKHFVQSMRILSLKGPRILRWSSRARVLFIPVISHQYSSCCVRRFKYGKKLSVGIESRRNRHIQHPNGQPSN